MSRPRILILTSSTGGGHDARAEAFAEWCFLLYRHDVDVRIEQMLEKSSVVNRSGVGIYNWIQKKVPGLHTLFFSAVEFKPHQSAIGALWEKILRQGAQGVQTPPRIQCS